MGEEARCGRNAGGEWTRLGDEAGPLPRATPAALWALIQDRFRDGPCPGVSNHGSWGGHLEPCKDLELSETWVRILRPLIPLQPRRFLLYMGSQ